MDWMSPYLLVALGCLVALEVWFVVAMAVTGRRYRMILRGLRRVKSPGALPDLEFEELGLLAKSEKRWAEVALLRLCLEGRVLEHGHFVLASGERVTETDRQGTDARAAILARLADCSHQHLNDLVWAGSRRGDTLAVYRRLTELGVTDERAVRIVRGRDRIMRWYLLLSCVPLAGAVVALAAMPAGATTGAGVGVLVFLQWIAVAALGPRWSGGWFRPLTPDGRAALERARERAPAGPDDRMLHQAALHGLEVFPEFQAAAERGTPDAGLGPRQRHGSALLDLLQSIADLFGPGPGTRQR